MTTQPEWWVTLRLDPGRTQDIRLSARSAWVAQWLASVLHPGREVLSVRPAHR